MSEDEKLRKGIVRVDKGYRVRALELIKLKREERNRNAQGLVNVGIINAVEPIVLTETISEPVPTPKSITSVRLPNPISKTQSKK